MATPSPKRVKVSESYAQPSSSFGYFASLVKEAQDVPFPWKEAVPEDIRRWFETFAKSHNTAPEYVFIGALATTAALMGPKCFVEVRETYREPANLFAICVGFPGSGKSQAYKMTVSDPLQSFDHPLSTMLVDDYTKKGLFRHLQNHDGRAYLAHEEMGAFFDLVQKRQLEGNAERQLYCRLYDGGRWTASTGLKKSEGRQETDHNCVCIHGYVQPQPFIERIYPQLIESDDGFVDRLLLCFPKTQVLYEEEVDDWCKKLYMFPLTSLVEPFIKIADWHKEDKRVYMFDQGGKEVYRSFSNEMAEIMNHQWQNCIFNQGNVSKDKRTMIRLSGIIHVLYKAMNTCLTEDASQFDVQEQQRTSTPARSSRSTSPSCLHDASPIAFEMEHPANVESELGSTTAAITTVKPKQIIKEKTARMAVALAEYFQQQRAVCDKVRGKSGGGSFSMQERIFEDIAVIILKANGAFCTPRSVVRSLTTKKRPSSAEIIEKMKELNKGGVGKLIAITEKEKVFYKLLPSDDNKQKIECYLDFEVYKECFERYVDTKVITPKQHNRILNKSPDKGTLMEEYQYKELQ